MQKRAQRQRFSIDKIGRRIAQFFADPTRDRAGVPRIESLEQRCLASVSTIPSIDGSGNNIANPTWGSVGVDFLRIAQAAYTDGVSSPAGADRPSAREVSNALAAQGTDTEANDRDLSDYIYAWGQFLDHDIDLTNTGSGATKETFSIAVPKGDPYFDPSSTGTQVITLTRSVYNANTGTTDARQQFNSITAFIDGSQVYGSDDATASSLRTFTGGLLKTSDGNLLPIDAATGFFQAGDIRANENVELTSMQTLFMREHNRVATLIAKQNPKLKDEAIYQKARMIVIGELQRITYNEFLPALLGSAGLPAYAGYNAKVNPGITNEFATAAFRFGHSVLNDDVEFLDTNGNEIREEISLAEAFFNPSIVKENGIDPMLKYLATDNANELDTQIVDSLRNFLFGPPGAGGLDLAALNIQRGRDHGLADYNTTRAAMGLTKITTFSQLTSDAALQQSLQATYGSVDNVDLWVGLLAEDHLPGSSVGALTRAILVDQFKRLRDGDRFWYQRTLKGSDLTLVNNTTLADVLRRNTTNSNIQDNVFFYKTEVTGQLFADNNRDGVRQSVEGGVAGRTIQLLDSTGAVVQSVQTDSKGTFKFDHIGIGTFTLQEVLPQGWIQTTPAPLPISITKGMSVSNVLIGTTNVPLPPPPTPAPTGPQAGPRQGPRPGSPQGPPIGGAFTLRSIDQLNGQ